MSSADGMRCFTFSSPLLPGAGVRLSQDSSKSIGFKLYPAALVLCRYIEESSCGGGGAAPSAASALLCAAGARPRVLELGAGVCGLPSLLLAARGAAATATDAGDVVAGLRANAAAAGAGVRVAELRWGDAGDAAAALVDAAAAAAAAKEEEPGAPCGCAAPAPPRALDLIVGADVVYHEELIAPLLDTLLALTAPPPPAAAGARCERCRARGAPPPVLLAYVQRFKRAKAFFKRAARWFDVERVDAGAVVDYQELSWALPGLRARCGAGAGGAGESAGGGGGPRLTSADASFDGYVALLRAAAAAAAADGESCAAPAAAAAAAGERLSDCSSEDEDRAWRGMVRSGGGGGGEGSNASPPSEIEALCLRLGVPAVRPTAAAVYILRRRAP
jgi:hypothetical protein